MNPNESCTIWEVIVTWCDAPNETFLLFGNVIQEPHLALAKVVCRYTRSTEGYLILNLLANSFSSLDRLGAIERDASSSGLVFKWQINDEWWEVWFNRTDPIIL